MIRIATTLRRRALIIPIVMVALLLVMLTAATLTRSLALHRRQMRAVEQRQQAFWLAESALQRAIRAAAKSPEYAGETWQVDAATLGAGQAGVAVIRVEPVAEPQAGRRIVVEASYPEASVHRTLIQREWFLGPHANSGVSP